MARGRTVSRSKDSNLNQRAADLLSSSLKTIQDAANHEPEESVDSSIEEQLAQAKASRSQAENARQKIANEILEATKEVCQKLIADGEQTLERAKKLEAEATKKQQQAHEELEKARVNREESESYAEKLKADAQKKAQERLDQAQHIKTEADAYRERVMAEVQQEAQEQLNQAQNIRTEADAYREKVITEAKEQGQEILYLARSAAEQECNEMKHYAKLEAQRTMAEAELVKAAVQEELEAQKIYAEAARLETESLEVLAQVRAKLADPTAFMSSNVEWENQVVQMNPDWETVEAGSAPMPAVEADSDEEEAEKPQSNPAPHSRRKRPSK